jgi:hypothetical protein
MFRRKRRDETILSIQETIFRFWRRRPETYAGYQSAQRSRRGGF